MLGCAALAFGASSSSWDLAGEDEEEVAIARAAAAAVAAARRSRRRRRLSAAASTSTSDSAVAEALSSSLPRGCSASRRCSSRVHACVDEVATQGPEIAGLGLMSKFYPSFRILAQRSREGSSESRQPTNEGEAIAQA